MNRRLTYAAAPLALALILSGCSGDSAEQATVTVTADSDATGTGADGDGTDTATDGEAADGESEEVVEPAQTQTIEINDEQSYSGEDSAFTLTVHRAVVNDYYVEVEITIVNDGDTRLDTWYGGGWRQMPRLFDDQGRIYPMQVQAGGDSETLRLSSGEGLDAVLAFTGRVGDNARSLTLDFSEMNFDDSWNQMTFDIPLGGQ